MFSLFSNKNRKTPMIVSFADDTQDTHTIIEGLHRRLQNLIRTIQELRMELVNSQKIIKLKDTELDELRAALLGSETMCDKVRSEFEDMKHDHKILNTSYKLLKLRSE